MTAYTFSQLFDFTRTTAGTFVGSNGLIQNTPASVNLLTFTQEFDNAAWTKNGLNAFGSGSSANSAAAPDGTLTADFLQENSLASNHGVSVSYTYNGTPHTLSCYFKASGRSRAELSIDTADAQAYATFDLVGSGSVLNIGTGAVATITLVGNGWYRCAVTYTPTAGTKTVRTRSGNAANDYFYTGDGTSGLLIWGAQLEANATATTYTRNNGGLFPARFDYDPVTLAPRGILIEEQRTNLLTYSAQFDDASWLKARASIVANTTVGPDGLLSADKLVEDTANNTHAVYKPSGIVSGTNTFSVYAKPDGRNWLCLETDTVNTRSFFNIATGTLGTIGSAVTATITPARDGWYRCTITGTFVGTMYILTAASDGGAVYAGNGTSGILIYGAQAEAGAFATSYIPTVASQVTRSADICNLTAPMFTPWYNTNEGTFVVEADTSFVGNFPVVVGYSAASTASFLYVTSGGKIGTWNGTTALDAVAGATTTNNAVFKAANAYAASSRNISMNGAAAASDANAVGSASFIALGKPGLNTSQMLNGHIRSIRYYPFRASNNQLQALTT